MLLVPYDGSALARGALQRARAFAADSDDDVLVVTVLPEDPEFARERGWITDGEPFDPDAIAERFARDVADLAPEAEFRIERPDEGGMLAATTMDVARTVRQVAHEVDADVVFIGSENAGRVSTPITSVGTPLSKDPDYDVYIVRHAD